MNQFSEIIGQEQAIHHIQNALRRSEISHAYILTGEPGSGRMALAETYGAALLCQHPREVHGLIEPCGVCPACMKTAAGSHADLQIYTQDRLAKQDRTKNTIGIKLIRDLVADVQIRPYEGGRKIYIVPEAERLTVEAQNALLKTLEEPPAYATLILIANGTSNFLPTILSRCVTLRMGAVGQETLTRHLTGSGIPEEQAVLAAGVSHGNPGMAQRMATSEAWQTFYQETMGIYENMGRQTAYELAAFAQRVGAMEPIGDDPDEAPTGLPVIDPVSAFLDLTQILVRDLLVCKSTGNIDGLILRDRIPYIRNIARELSFEALQAMQEEIRMAEERRRVGTKPEQYIEVMLLAMRENMR